MARTVVCISHAAGAGGEEVGRLVAERLGFLYVNEEIVARAAAKGGVEAARRGPWAPSVRSAPARSWTATTSGH
jgi:hypothetical protein